MLRLLWCQSSALGFSSGVQGISCAVSLAESHSLHIHIPLETSSVTIVSDTVEFTSVYFRHFEVHFNINVNLRVNHMY